ncbi:MAG: AAA family ATPase [Deltaproteobacteria bacterium]
MSLVAIVSPDPRLEELLKSSGLQHVRLDSEAALTSRTGPAPSVVVFDLRGRNQLPGAVVAYRRAHADSAVVLVVSALDPRMMLEAMRAGVTECVPEPLTPVALEEAVRRVLVDTDMAPVGQVFAFLGAKGGVGTTTLAVNTAAALAHHKDGDVLMADMHLANGDAAVFLSGDAKYSVVDALENVHRLDDALLRSLVVKTGAGLDLLASSDRPLVAGVDARRTRDLIEFAARRYRYVILDVPRSDMSTLDALDPATSIVVIASQEVAALKSAARMADRLKQRYGARVRVAVNRFDKKSEIGQADIERVVGLPVTTLIPSDYRAAIEALNTGRPLATNPDHALARAFRAFANDLAGVAKKPKESPNMLARLAFRRA